MNDDDLLRYSRHIFLPQVDVAGQQKLLESTVLIIGMGGLGSPVAMYLASSGIGQMIIADFDTVEVSNLQRQIVHTQNDIGKSKVDSAAETLQSINPDVSVTKIQQRLNSEMLNELLPQVDVVIDGCDNFETRFAVNKACVAHNKPLVSGAAIRFEGQVSIFNADKNSPCYHCLYKDNGEEEQTCSENGILAPVTGLIGSIQAIETIKLLLELGETLSGKLLIIDSLTMDFRTLNLKKDPSCPVCSTL